jgi:hypothetical protein
MNLQDVAHCFTIFNLAVATIIALVLFSIFVFVGGTWTVTMGMSGRKDYNALLNTINKLKAEGKFNFANLKKKHSYVDNVIYYEISQLDPVTVEALKEIC